MRAKKIVIYGLIFIFLVVLFSSIGTARKCMLGSDCASGVCLNGDCTSACAANWQCGFTAILYDTRCYGDTLVKIYLVPTCAYLGTSDSFCYLKTTKQHTDCSYGCSGSACIIPECISGYYSYAQCGTSSIGTCEYGSMSRYCSGGFWGSWTSCSGAVYPKTEICGDNLDNDCDGNTDEGCPECVSGVSETKQCGTSNIGACEYGTKSRICTGGLWGSWGSCVGAVYPTTEIYDGLDNDCDNLVDEDYDGCTNGEVEIAQCGATNNTGACQYGNKSRTCSDHNWGNWTNCDGAVYATTEACWDSIDNDCDGSVDEECPECISGVSETKQCGTTDIGACEYGNKTRLCTAGLWGGWGICEGAVYSEEEICLDSIDNDCDGDTDEGCSGYITGDNPIGECSETRNSTSACENGTMNYTWNGTFKWNESNVADSKLNVNYVFDTNDSRWHYDSEGAYSACMLGGETTLTCSLEETHLPFFSLSNLLIAILTISGFYLLKLETKE